MADDSPINTTYFGYEGDETPDRASAAGIGDHDNLMIPGYDVGLNNAAREFFGVTRKGQEFIDHNGVPRRAGDSVPEIYQDARMDIYTGPKGGPGMIDTGYGVVPHDDPVWRPGSEDPYDDPRTHTEGAPVGEEGPPHADKPVEPPQELANQQHQAEQLFSPQSMIAKVRAVSGKNYVDWKDDELWAKFSKKFPTPLEQMKALDPGLAELKDDDIVKKVNAKYFPKEDIQDTKDRLSPPSGIAGATSSLLKGAGELAKFTVSQFLPQSSLQLQEEQRSFIDTQAFAAKKEANQTMSTLYPTLDDTAKKGLVAGFIALPKAARIKAIDHALRENPTGAEKLKSIGGVAQISTAFDTLAGAPQLSQERKELSENIKKTQEQSGDDPKLGGTWSTVGRTLAGFPVAIALSAIPVVREGSNYAQLHDQNKVAVLEQNPKMNPDEVEERAHQAALAQLPLFEVASFLKIGAASAITKGISNKVLRAGANLATTVGGVTGALTTQQVIQNMSAGAPLGKDVDQAAVGGLTLGLLAGSTHGMISLAEVLMSRGNKSAKQSVNSALIYQGTHAQAPALDYHEGFLLPDHVTQHGVDGLEKMLLQSPSGRAVSGAYQAALGMSETQAREFMRGKDNPIDQAVKASAVDMFIGAVDGNPKLRDGLSSAGKEAYQKAIAAHVKGDYEEAKNQLQATLVTMSDDDKADLGRSLRSNLLNKSGPIGPERQLPAPRSIIMGDKERGFTMAGPRAHEGTILAEGPKPRLTLEDRQQQAIDDQMYTGSTNPDEAIPAAFDYEKFQEMMSKRRGRSGAVLSVGDVAEAVTSPLAPARNIIKGSWLGKTGHLIKDVFAIGEVSHATETTQSISAHRQAIRDERNTRDIDMWYRQQQLRDKLMFAIHADRRISFWARYPKRIQKEMLFTHDEGFKTGDRLADSMDHYSKGLNRAFYRAEQADGMTFPFREHYIYRILKDKNDAVKVENYLRNKGIDPNFMKQRGDLTLRELDKLGIEMATYNREEIDQARYFASTNARMKMDVLDDLAKAGIAVKHEALHLWRNPQEIIDQSTEYHSPRGLYHVHKDAANYLHRVWDSGVLENTTIGKLADKAIIKPAILIKAKSIGVVLSFSGFHQLHFLEIGASAALTHTQRAFLEGHGTGADLLNAFLDVATTGAYTMGKSYIKYARGNFHETPLLDYYKGNGVKFKDLTESNKQLVLFNREAGFVPYVDHERRQQFIHTLASRVPRRMGAPDWMMDLGYKITTNVSYQRYLFESQIPAIQQYMMAKNYELLFKAHPELLDPKNDTQRVLALTKLRKYVEGVTGEGAMRNADIPKAMKQIGMGVMLSLGWKMTGARTFGKGALSLLNNTAHADKLVETMKKEGALPVAKRVLTNDLLYAGNYTAMTLFRGWLITGILGGAFATGAAITLHDMLYPIVGKNKDGTAIRAKPPTFTTEIATIGHEGLSKALTNTVQPMLQTIINIGQNKDYRGTQIYDPTASSFEDYANRAKDVAGFILKQSMPFSIQNAINTQGDEGAYMATLGFFGLPKAANWTTQNWIDDSVRSHIGEKTKGNQEKHDAGEAYRLALHNKDSHQAQAALKELHRLGATDRAIQEIERTKDTTTGERHFKSLDKDVQIKMLKKMNPSELKHYFPLASKAAQEDFKHEKKLHH